MFVALGKLASCGEKVGLLLAASASIALVPDPSPLEGVDLFETGRESEQGSSSPDVAMIIALADADLVNEGSGRVALDRPSVAN